MLHIKNVAKNKFNDYNSKCKYLNTFSFLIQLHLTTAQKTNYMWTKYSCVE